MEELSKLPKLKEVKIEKNYIISGKGLTKVINLNKLTFSDCKKLQNDSLSDLIESLINLKLVIVNGYFNNIDKEILFHSLEKVLRNRKNNLVIEI